MKIYDKIKINYVTIGHPTAFSSPQRVYNFYHKKVSLAKIKDILSEIDSYTLHKKTRKFKRNVTYCYNIRERWDIDLVDLQRFSKSNTNTKYLLNCVDIFSR